MVNMLPGLRRNQVAPQSDDRGPGYYLMPGDWNTTVKRDGLSLDEVYDVLDSFDDVYQQAMDGLKQVDPASVPRSVRE